MTYVGIDLHANNMVIVAINGKAEVIREAKLPTSHRALKNFCGHLEAPIRAVVGKELAKGVWHMLTKDQEYKRFKGQPTRIAPRTYWPQPISPSA